MSSKESLIEWIRQLPDEYGLRQLLAALYQRCDREQRGGTQQAGDDYEWPAADLTEDEWRQFVAHGLREQLADTREDIYTPEDGVPTHEQG